MLNLVRKFWVTDVLERSLYGEILIQLGLEARPEAVAGRPWNMVLQMPDQPDSPLPRSTRIVDIFYAMNELNRTLLILGEPGSGKTTMLLELARDTIVRAQQDPNEPIPVVFNLSSWVEKRQPIADWLVDELNDKYFIPRKIGRPWIEDDALLLLLDGLDEVQESYRDDCVEAINRFHHEHTMPMVVCSRAAEYEALATKLAFESAVLLRPLTPRQIHDYIEAVGSELAAVGQVLQQDTALQELARSPLMLNVMTLAYRGLPPGELRSFDSVQAHREHLLNAYVQRMFEHGSPVHLYPPEQTIRWLSWLARRMSRHTQSIFVIEQLQPGWLPDPAWRRAYVFASRLAVSLLGGLVGGLMIGAGFALFFSRPAEGLIRGLAEGVAGCLIGGLVVGAIDITWTAQNGAGSEGTHTNWRLIANILAVSLSVGLSVWLGFVLIFGLGNWLGKGMDFWLVEGLSVGLLVGLCFGLIFGYGSRGSRQTLTRDVRTVEYLNWSRGGIVEGSVYGVLGGLVSGLILSLISLVAGQFMFDPLTALFPRTRILLLTVPILGLIGAIFGGLQGSIVRAPETATQRMRSSYADAGWIGLGIGATFGLIGALVGRLAAGNIGVLTYGLYGLFFGLLAAIWYGGLDIVKHYVLRFILCRRGHLPWRYARFLDYAADRIFLRKVGRGYIFIHRLLLEHFTRMGQGTADER